MKYKKGDLICWKEDLTWKTDDYRTRIISTNIDSQGYEYYAIKKVYDKHECSMEFIDKNALERYTVIDVTFMRKEKIKKIYG